jgi:hypothetical protein
MKRFTNAIRKCLDTCNWYGALFISLTMPDICGNIAYPDLNTYKRYTQWFDNYLSNYYKGKVGKNREETVFMSAKDCYALRCSLFHTGMDDVTEQKAADVISRFSFSAVSSHCNLFDDVLQLNVKIFCEQTIQAVEKWGEDIEDNPATQSKINKLITIHEGGYSPLSGIRVE